MAYAITNDTFPFLNIRWFVIGGTFSLLALTIPYVT